VKIALHSVSYSGTVTPDQAALPLMEVMHKAASLGFDGITLAAKRPHALPLDLSPADREQIAKAAADLGLEIACVAGYNDFCRSSAFDREINLSYTIACIKLARDVGAPIVRTFASGMGDYHQGASIGQQIEWTITLAKEAARVAEDLGVTLVIQNHSPIGNDIYNLRQIVDGVDSPCYKVAVDCPLLTSSGVDYAEALGMCEDVMAFTTAGDWRFYPGPVVRLPGGQVVTRRELMVPLGQGECDWPSFLKLLKEIGYDYWINYEMCSPAREGGSEANLDRIASASLAYIRREIDDVYGQN
jgi:sugar phosphate isomerase/epimerase